MNKKLVVIAGQTGVGKTELAQKLALSIKGEIVVVDSMQIYKGLNILANKPSVIFTQSVKYHNTDQFELSKNSNLNGSHHIEKIRSTIADIWSRGMIPILEGGCGFYFKMLLTGSSSTFSAEEETEYNNFISIAREVIRYDANFFKSYQRLLRLDKSFPESIKILNDFYRLEKRLAEAYMFGDGAYKFLREREESAREQTRFSDNCEVLRFFLFLDKIDLLRKQQTRCEKMIQQGLIEEVVNLVKDGTVMSSLSSNSAENRNLKNLFLNVIGFRETLDYLWAIQAQNKNRSEILSVFSSNFDSKKNSVPEHRRKIEKIVYNYLEDMCVSHRRYAKRQATWFKHNGDFLWVKADSGEDNLLRFVKDTYLNMPHEEFTKHLNSYKNITEKKSYNINNGKFKYFPKFHLLEDKNKLFNFLIKSFDEVKKIDQELVILKAALEKNGKNFEIEQSLVDTETIKKYLLL